jgi:VanZ family protein
MLIEMISGRLRPAAGETCYPDSVKTIFKIIAWLPAAAVTFATLGPARLRPHSNLGQDGEHTLAFILIGLAFGFAYTGNRLRTAAVAVILSGVLELLQLVVPGRHARLEDFIVDALEACAGLIIAAVLSSLAMQAGKSE